jgi:chemotaxis protein methyltransferase CheR
VCKRISRRIRELGLADAAAYRAHLEAHADEWPVLDACCRVSISRFYRDRAVFEQLGGSLLPDLARAAIAEERRVLRAWSAGCASGEEPYTLRMVWDLEAGLAFPDVELEILGTDASPVLLERASRAIYEAGSLRDLPAGWRDRAFRELDGAWALRSELVAGVELRRADIREGMPAGPFDLILCRNLAFTYFDEALQDEVLEGLVARLVPEGALVIGARESLNEPPGLARSPDAAGVFRKTGVTGAPSPSATNAPRQRSS